MKKNTFMPTRDEILQFVKGVDAPTEPVNTKYAAIAYLSMCQHPYMSAEWLIAEFTWKESIEKISDCRGSDIANTIKTRIEEHYKKRELIPNIDNPSS